MEPQDRPEWTAFVAWATANDVSLEYEDDWHPWWECFFAGVCHAMNNG